MENVTFNSKSADPIYIDELKSSSHGNKPALFDEILIAIDYKYKRNGK